MYSIRTQCLFNLYAEYIMRNAGLDEAQAAIEIAWRIPWIEEPGRLQSMVSQRVRHDSVTSLFDLPLEKPICRSGSNS